MRWTLPRKCMQHLVDRFNEYLQRVLADGNLLVSAIVNGVAKEVAFQIAQSKESLHVHSLTLPPVVRGSVTTRAILQMHRGVPDLSDHRKSPVELIAGLTNCLCDRVVIAQLVKQFSERIHCVHERVGVNEGHFVTVGPRGYP